MKKSVMFIALGALSLSGCGKKEESFPADVREETRPGAPDIAPTAAPGVAFSYAYQFLLPDNAIAKVQEEHAHACEQLGLARCRITGLRYTVTGEKTATARLELKLAPDIARTFGKTATSGVEKVGGTLSDMEITGEDHGQTIADADRAEAAAAKETGELKAQLARKGLGDRERMELQRRISDVQANRSLNAGAKLAAQAAVASTPMILNYSSNGFVPGFDLGSSVRSALGFAGAVLQALLSMVIVLGTVAVPLGIGAILFAHLRRIALRLWRKLVPPEPEYVSEN